ncbi:MAG: NYN domain-containing protein [Acidimicrobiaceae bacterium]|nr:NYN domain-containing protein [Acidimicrobiaceae bacterium]
MPGDRVVVFIDYQNVYHRARSSFFEGAKPPVQAGHVHPLKVGELLRDLGRSKDSGRVLAAVRVYRAVPDMRSGTDLERATKIQIAGWETETGVKVCTRPMDYIETTRRGKQHWVGREKGIDVMLAVDLVDMARTDTYDAAVVFSADTDLLPALETAVRIGKRIETATWRGPGDNRGPLRIKQHNLWNHYLEQPHFDLVRDDTDYLRPPSD